MKKNNLFATPSTKEEFIAQMHKLGRIFTWIALVLILGVPVAFCIATKSLPDWSVLGASVPFILGYVAIGLIEAISYAPLLGTGGQYLSFITGNIANLKLPAAINAQNITKVEAGSEEQEIVTTIAIAISSMVTTLIIIIGLIPLAVFRQEIVTVLQPISPYVIPAIFGGLTMVLIARYYKQAVIPFAVCIVICVVENLIGMGSSLGQSTMIIIGMVVSIIANAIIYTKKEKKNNYTPPEKKQPKEKKYRFNLSTKSDDENGK